ncbi:hypothetical protein H4R24_000609 [Coemansia sp. RSA 988]|nr:hypothetical protein H4R24_000609 [Coemansia sp. RSA 988]
MAAYGAFGSHIRKNLVQIKDDAIVLVDATTTLDSSTGRIARLSISPPGPLVGTRGIVYALPDLVDCQPVKRSKQYLAESYIRIALVADDGNCPVAAKIAQAQYDGAVGALVYNNTLGAADMCVAMRNEMKKHKPKIPVMTVDRQYGETLQLEIIALLDEAWHESGNQFRAIFASMYPEDEGEHLSAWEITLISLVAILAFGLSTSLLFHIISSRRRRLADNEQDNGGMGELSKKIETLPTCALDRLLLRTVSNSDVNTLSECTSPLDVILNPSRSNRSLGASSGGPHDQDVPCSDKDKEPNSVPKGCIATCIVCIDEFAVGSKMRILPCGHNYHIECIDPWLTSKSSLCPLCKYDTRDVLTDLERAYSGPRVIEDLSFRYSLDTSEPSSYLAESRAQIQLAGAMRRITNLAYRVTTPMRAFTRKVKGTGLQVGDAVPTGHEDIAMSLRQTSESQLERGLKTGAGATGPGLVPITYSMNIGGDDRPGLIGLPHYSIGKGTEPNAKCVDRACSPACTSSSSADTAREPVPNQSERLKERRGGINIYDNFDDDEDILAFDKHMLQLSLDSIYDDTNPKATNK